MAPSFHPDSLPDLSSQVYLVTGGNAGIGFFTVLHLAKRHARVYIASRSASKANKAIAEMKTSLPEADIRCLEMDLMDLNSVVAAAKSLQAQEKQLHGLVNNAGIMATPFLMSKDGYESQWQTNYLAHWLLTYHLLPLLQKAAENSPDGVVRIVNVTSTGHTFAPTGGINFADTSLKDAWTTWRRYGQSKLANILHTTALEKRFGVITSSSRTSKIWTAAVHPGAVDTELGPKDWTSRLFKGVLRCFSVFYTPEQGAYNSLFAVASLDFTRVGEHNSGSYFVPIAKKATPTKLARDPELADKLWNWTENEMKAKGFI